ncbi:MAG: hypothetical protein VX874_11250 [Pseudomonadota bacterium]|nr:hypothetical protein [Pseudomonadota bacterium]
MTDTSRHSAAPSAGGSRALLARLGRLLHGLTFPERRARAVRQARQIDDLIRTTRRLESMLAEQAETTRQNRDLLAHLKRIEELAVDAVEFSQAAAGNGAIAARHATTVRRAGQPVRVGFLVHHYEAWGALRRVHALMVEDPRFEPVVFSIPRRFPGARGFGDEDGNSAGLTSEGIAHIRLNDPESVVDMSRIKSFDLEVVFRQAHWQKDLPGVFRTDLLTFATQYYVPYAIAPLITSGGGIINHTRKDVLARQFVAGDIAKSIIVAQDRLSGARVTVSGHPKVAEIQSATPSWPIGGGNTARIIWSAHHAIDGGWNAFGTFPDVCDAMLDLARRRPDLDILFSPHPALLTRLGGMSGERRARFDQWFADWDALPNTDQLRTGQYLGPFAASDLLVVDGLSFLMEYQLLKKPVVYLSRPDNSPWNAMGEMVVQGVHELPAAKIAGIEALIDGLLDGAEPRKEAAQQALIDELTPRGDPARFIVETIHADLRTPALAAHPEPLLP